METKQDKVKVVSTLARGDSYFLAPNSTIYYTRSEDDVERMYEDDRRCLNTMNDAGESRVHSRQGSARVSSPTTVIITRLNGSEWHGWGKKPL